MKLIRGSESVAHLDTVPELWCFIYPSDLGVFLTLSGRITNLQLSEDNKSLNINE